MEVAKMDEYISKQAFKEKYLFCGWLPEMSKKEFDDFPAADVVEVRHGRWVDENKNPVPWDECNSKCPSHSAYCSECGEWLTASDEYPVTGLYCPNCGALMREIENGEK